MSRPPSSGRLNNELQGASSSTGVTIEAVQTACKGDGSEGRNTSMPTTAENASCNPWPLELLPGSWLYQFIRTSPVESQRALFTCNTRLAKLVLQSVTKVRLSLMYPGYDYAVKDIPAQQTQRRRSIITNLLRARQEFEVLLLPAPYQPFPTELADRVVELGAGWRDDMISTCCQWDTMCNLRTLYLTALNINTLDEDIAGVCAAVEAGQLQQLRSFGLHLDSSCKGTIHNLERLVHSLGTQLEELSANCGPLLMKLHHFPALRSVTLNGIIGGSSNSSDSSDSDAIMLKMFEHPTLSKVTFGKWNWWYWCSLQRDYSQRTCNWETLTLHCSNLNMLLRLPLAHVQLVRLVGYVSGSVAEDAEGHACVQQAAADMLKRHGEKIVCEGSKECWDLTPCMTFRMTDACEAMLPLLKLMPGVEALMLEQYSYAHTYKTGVLTSFLQGVPESVRKVTCRSITRFKTSQLWQSLPQHVTQLSLEDCAIDAPAATKLVHTTPAHVSKLIMLAMDKRLFDAREAARLRKAAPAHLQFKLTFN